MRLPRRSNSAHAFCRYAASDMCAVTADMIVVRRD